MKTHEIYREIRNLYLAHATDEMPDPTLQGILKEALEYLEDCYPQPGQQNDAEAQD